MHEKIITTILGFIVLPAVLFVCIIAVANLYYFEPIDYDVAAVTLRRIILPDKNNQPVTDNKPIEVNIATSTEINLAVPFQSQAPFANWVLPYEDACEEASIIMVDHYLRHVGLSKQQMKDEIDQEIAWETKQWGYHINLSVEKIVQVIAYFYNYQTKIITDLTIDKIKTELSQGNPVIIPAAGRLLGNPNFHSPGPIYHMLVIRGYTADGRFITNDPGTRKGGGYIYDADVLLNAVHDWDGTNPDGPKIGLVIYK